MTFPPAATLLTICLLVAATGYGQQRLNLFTDCECNKTLLKQELDYVNHTIDPVSAQVNLFIVTNYLSNGGRVYDLQFKGQQELAENSLSFKVSTTAVMTSLERDEYLNKRIELGLAGFLAGTEYAELVDLTAQAPPEVEEVAGEEDVTPGDGWNNWIFEAFARFGFEKESQRSETEVRAGFEADRTTPDWRLRFSPNMYYRLEQITRQSGEVAVSLRRDQWFNGKVVKSISNHWSVGLLTYANASTFRNIDLGLFVAPAIEYNIFDYNEVPFKEFTIAYRVGYVYNNYIDTTVLLQTEESLTRQSLDVNLRLRQRWGQVNAGVSAANYLGDFSQNRLSIELNTSVRVIKGLSLTFGGSYQIINDQINLPLRNISEQDRLLGVTQLATSYSADVNFGFSYTFGSLFNNVINTRL